MPRIPKAFPPSHEVALNRVMRLIDIIAERPALDDNDVVSALFQSGLSEVDAELLIRFVPCALSFALLKLMGARTFPSTFQVKNNAGQWVELPLAREHYFSAALGVGYDVTTRGYNERISREIFQAVASRSAEMNLLNRFFAAGGTKEELSQAVICPPILLGITAEQIAASRPSA
jgi:hypothetical protein